MVHVPRDAIRAVALEHSSRGSKPKFICVEFTDLHSSEENSVKSWCHQFESEFLESKHFADKDSVLVPANVSRIIHSP